MGFETSMELGIITITELNEFFFLETFFLFSNFYRFKSRFLRKIIIKHLFKISQMWKGSGITNVCREIG